MRKRTRDLAVGRGALRILRARQGTTGVGARATAVVADEQLCTIAEVRAHRRVDRQTFSHPPPSRLFRVPVGTRDVSLHDVGYDALVVDNKLIA